MARMRSSWIGRTVVMVVALAGVATSPTAVAQCDDEVKFGDAILHTLPISQMQVAMRAGDFDLDGDVDIASIFYGAGGSQTAALIACQDDGWVFDDCASIRAGWVNDAAFVDLDGDGYLDAALVTLGELRILPNDGTGHFNYRLPRDIGKYLSSIRGGDIDGDGDSDLVIACGFNNEVAVLLNDGAGNLAPPIFFAAGDGPQSLVLGDFDGDGYLDVATGDQDGESVSVLLNRGDGSFESPTHWPAAGAPSSIACGDFDHDGDLDLVTANPNSDDVSLLLNNGDATFAPPITLSSGDEPVSIVAGDLDGDGGADIIVANRGGSTVRVFLSDGGSKFLTIDLHLPTARPTCVALADLDADTDLDIVVGTDNHRFYVFPNTGTYTARIIRQPADAFACPGDSVSLSVGATGTGLEFQWLKDGVAITGATSATLTISAASESDEGEYRVVVTNGCSTATSDVATLTVNDGDCCASDFNRDGQVNSEDYSQFAEAFDSADPAADFNADGFVNGDDYDAFAEHFDAGC